MRPMKGPVLQYRFAIPQLENTDKIMYKLQISLFA